MAFLLYKLIQLTQILASSPLKNPIKKSTPKNKQNANVRIKRFIGFSPYLLVVLFLMEKATLLTKKYDKLMSKHPGKWVAITDDKVIATAKNIEELTQKIKELNDIFVAYSPTSQEKKVGYLLQTMYA